MTEIIGYDQMGRSNVWPLYTFHETSHDSCKSSVDAEIMIINFALKGLKHYILFAMGELHRLCRQDT